MRNQTRRWILFWLLAIGSGGMKPASAGPAAPTESLLAATCPPGGSYKGSLHAAVSYETLFEPPKRKSAQTYSCKSGPVAVYIYDYGDAKTAEPQSAFLGAKLWGGPGPTLEHTDELLVSGGTLIVLSGAGQQDLVDVLVKQRGFVPYRGGGLPLEGSAKADVSLTGVEDAAGLARAFAAVLTCNAGSTDLLRAFCPVAQLDQGTFVAPTGVQTYPGMSITVPRGGGLRSSLLTNLSFSVLVLSPERAFLQELASESPEERKELLSGLTAVSAALKSGGAVGTLSQGISEELKTLRAKLSQQGNLLKRDGKRVLYSGKGPASELYLVNTGGIRAYVVLERVSDGLFFSIFPAPAAKKS